MLLLHQKEIEISSWKTTSHSSDIEKSVYLMWNVVLHEKALLSNSRKWTSSLFDFNISCISIFQWKQRILITISRYAVLQSKNVRFVPFLLYISLEAQSRTPLPVHLTYGKIQSWCWVACQICSRHHTASKENVSKWQ